MAKQETKLLPGITVVPEVYELLRRYGYENNINSLAAVVRHLLSESESLKALAVENGVDLSELEMIERGGYRPKNN